MSFRDEVTKEAREQRLLREAGRPIPPELRRYARLSALAVIVVSTAVLAFSLYLGSRSGRVYVFADLFAVALAGIGLVQLISGRHFLNRGR